MKLTAIGAKIRRDIQNFGVAKTAYEVLMEGINLCVDFRITKVMKVEAVNPDYLESKEPLQWQFLNKSQLFELVRNPENKLSERFVETALEKGDECYGALDGDALACYGWYSNNPTDDNGLTVHFSPDYMYMYAGFTVPKYRGKRLITIAMHRALRDYLSRGFKGLIYYINLHNFSCLQTLTRRHAKSRDIGRVVVLKLGSHVSVHNSRGCREHGVFLAKPTAVAAEPVLTT
ncbi:MAG: hypothetical protein WD648_00975 [Planctomycetaceae bacterium]